MLYTHFCSSLKAILYNRPVPRESTLEFSGRSDLFSFETWLYYENKIFFLFLLKQNLVLFQTRCLKLFNVFLLLFTKVYALNKGHFPVNQKLVPTQFVMIAIGIMQLIKNFTFFVLLRNKSCWHELSSILQKPNRLNRRKCGRALIYVLSLSFLSITFASSNNGLTEIVVSKQIAHIFVSENLQEKTKNLNFFINFEIFARIFALFSSFSSQNVLFFSLFKCVIAVKVSFWLQGNNDNGNNDRYTTKGVVQLLRNRVEIR